MNSRDVEILIAGSGAADHDWTRLGEPGVKGSSSTLIGSVLIDCGVTGRENLARFGISPERLTDLVITHSHDDHFTPQAIAGVVADRSPASPALRLRASPQIVAALRRSNPSLKCELHEVLPGDRFTAGGFTFTALPANHPLPDPGEQAMHYLIETPAGNILYALDGAWLLKPAIRLIGEKVLSLIFWDATMAESGDWRIWEHNDLEMIDLMMRSLIHRRNAGPETRVILTHTARTLWPPNEAEARRLADQRGWTLAVDGMRLTLPAAPRGASS